MPLVLLPLVLLAFIMLMMLLLPLSIIQRYRSGTARRLARGWVAAINGFGFGMSAMIILITAAIANVWIPGTFLYGLAGFVGGGLLGMMGLRLTSWEKSPAGLHYTPNRWLVLAIALAVVLRLSFGFWRGWQAWRATADDESWIAESGLAGSLAAGALVLGYYLTYWLGVWVRARKFSNQALATLGRR